MSSGGVTWPSPVSARREIAWAGGLSLLALLIGWLLSRSPLLALGGVGAVALAPAVLRFGFAAVLVATLAPLPWLVVFDGLIPPLLRTFVTAAAALAMVAYLAPLRYRNRVVVVGAALFGATTAGNAIFATDGEQLIQFAKYLIFPTVALAVLSRSARDRMWRTRNFLLGTCVAALIAHLGIVAAGLGSSDTYYGIGEQLGFAGAHPHELALLGVVVAAAGLVAARRTAAQLSLFAVGAVPAALTGVRSALLALVVVLLALAVQSRLSPRTVAVLVGVAIVAFASGAMDTISARFSESSGEFGSVATAGSGRGEIWSVAVDRWAEAGPGAWLFGTGLQSIRQFQLEELGKSFVGHSDVVEVGVDLGVVGLLSWVAIWVALLRGELRALVLIPIAVFALVNGSIEYVAPQTVGMALAAACYDGPPGPSRPPP